MHAHTYTLNALDDQNWERKINEIRMHIEIRSLLIFVIAVIASSSLFDRHNNTRACTHSRTHNRSLFFRSHSYASI